MTAYTTPDGLPYPDNYNDPADVPAAMEALASAVQIALNTKPDTETVVGVGRQIVAGSGLTGGGTLASDRTLHVGAGTGITVTEDAVEVNQGVIASRAYVDSGLAGRAASVHYHDDRYYTEAEVNYGLSLKAPLAYRENSYPGEGGINAWVWNIGTLTAGQEVEATWGIPDGSYVNVCVQHHSTYIFAVANLISSTQVTVRCRNSTTATTHTNVKVHIWVLNPAN